MSQDICDSCWMIGQDDERKMKSHDAQEMPRVVAEVVEVVDYC